MNAAAINYYPNYFSKASYSARFLPVSKSAGQASFGFLGIVISFLIILASAGYFLEINSVASLGYEMKAYQKSIDSLKDKNQKMKIIMAESISFKNIENPSRLEKLNMVSVSEYQYLTMPSSSFAEK